MSTASSRRPWRGRRGSRVLLRVWDWIGSGLVNLLAVIVVVLYLFPLSYMLITSLKEDAQLGDVNAPIWPASVVTFHYKGRDHPVYNVPTDGGVQEWALVNRRREDSDFIDPDNPAAGLITWEGRWRQLDPVYRFHLAFDNYSELWERVDFPELMRNTVAVTVLGGVGVLVSSILVAYGFARFPIPGGNVLFMLLIGTILIPDKVTLVPTYFMFVRVLEWNGTWLPLIVPQFFGNAILIFLLRQNFKSISREVDEAAKIDGAGPLRTLIYVILPSCLPAVATVSLLHFFYAWNEIRMASLYLGISPELHTIAFGTQRFQSYFPTANTLQASALIAIAVPAIVLFLVQRVFMEDVLVTGLEK